MFLGDLVKRHPMVKLAVMHDIVGDLYTMLVAVDWLAPYH